MKIISIHNQNKDVLAPGAESSVKPDVFFELFALLLTFVLYAYTFV